MKKIKGSMGLVILIVILMVIVVVAIGTAIYFWQKNNQLKTTQTSNRGINQESPKEIVEIFMNATLGTLPEAEVDYDLARTHMTDKLKTQHLGEGWVPQFYGIQDGPISVKFISQNISGDSATVRFDPNWGEMSLGWAFILTKENNKWLVDEFRSDTQ